MLDDLDAEALQCWDVRRLVGEQADFADAEVGEDLSTEADLAQDALRVARRGILCWLCIALAAVEAELWLRRGVDDTEAAVGLVQIDQRSAAGGGDSSERGIDGCGTVAE